MSMIRTRWAAVGAAVAVTLGAGGLTFVDAAKGSGERPVTVTIEPCRLRDTRPTKGVGGRITPLGPAEAYTVQATGTSGNCNIPGDATGLVVNVTADQATQATNLRLYPTGGAVPTTSNLNPRPGAAPTPNGVTVGLDGSGQFDIRNAHGTVHIIIDVTAYLVDHHHNDRYYTKDEIDALHATETKFSSIPPTAFTPRYPAATGYVIEDTGELVVVAGTQDEMSAPVFLPDGAHIDALHAWVTDQSLFDTPTRNLRITLDRLAYDGTGTADLFNLLSGYQPSPTKLTDNIPNGRSTVVDNEAYMYVVRIDVPDNTWGDFDDVIQLHGVTIEYSV